VERNLLKINKKSSTKKNIKKTKKFFYKLKKMKKAKEKNYFREICAKKVTPKWTNNKIGNAKTGRS